VPIMKVSTDGAPTWGPMTMGPILGFTDYQ
jgi:hypothetical protein